MKLKIIILLLIICIKSNGFSQNETATAFYDQAYQAIEDGEYKEALKLIDQAISIDASPDMFWLKYLAYNHLREFESEYQTLNEGLSRFPNSGKLYASRGLCERRMRNFDTSLRDYGFAIKFSENDTLRWSYTVDRAWVRFLNRDFEGCRKDCLDVLKEDSLNVSALSNMAMAYEAEFQFEKALGYLNQILAFDSTNVVVIMNVGFVYQKDGQFEKSIEYFNRAIELDPNEGIAYNNRSYSKLMLNDLKGALDDVNKGMELHPNNSYAYRNRALIYIEMKKMKKACKDIELALEWGFTRSYGNEVLQLQRKYCN